MTSLAAELRHAGRGAVASTRLNLLVSAQYRANMAVWSIASLLQIVVYMSVWRAVAAAGGGTSGGYSAGEFAGYFLILTIVRELTMTWMPYEFAGYVRSGRLSTLLVRPLHPLIYVGCGMISFRLQSMMLVIPSAVLLFIAFDAQVHTTVTAVLFALVVVPLASVTRFLADTLLALTSMWLVRIDGIRGIYYMLLLLLGGQFAPVTLLPHTLQLVAKGLPFYWTLGYPTELLTGKADVGEAWIGVLVLAAWSSLLLWAVRVTWRAGTRAYEAVGS